MQNNDFKQWVPQKICLSCDGCCRFSGPESLWRPKLLIEEASEDIVVSAVDDKNYLKPVPKDGWMCPFLECRDNACRIYSSRPWECQLYPFLVVKKDGEIFLGVHLNCPYVEQHKGTKDYEAYVGYLRKYFQSSETQKILKENPHIAGEYPQDRKEIEYLFALKEGSAV